MPNNSPKIAQKPRTPQIPLSARRFSQPLPSKYSKLYLSVANNASKLREGLTTPFTSTTQTQNTSKNQAKKRKKKKKSCYTSCCCVLFLMMLAFIFVFILQESWDPDGELAVKFLETEVLHDIAGPSVELPGMNLRGEKAEKEGKEGKEGEKEEGGERLILIYTPQVSIQ